MKFEECDRLLDTRAMPLEMGFERLTGGVLHVACRTDMPECTGDMLEWWFRFRPTSREYIWWHPVDHVASAWIDVQDDTHIGSIHQAEERFGSLPAQKLSLQFCDPVEFMSAAKLQQARFAKQVSGIICARVGPTFDPPRDHSGGIVGSRLLHVARDNERGCVLRSHFFIGQDLPAKGMPQIEVEKIAPTEFAEELLQHCFNEFTYLSRFLPSLYIAENRDSRPILHTPW